ncbi:protein arginine N-methyltransferase 7 [Planococcus citri]|uniref:protein arginine N-methyltransferase 7 n=1 Tax=Planococcus citri TaxID=170843 RepID=UPI0031F9E450
MSVFASKFNPISGKVEWIQMDDAFDYSQQIARSAYADMLHDTDRNRKYYDALKISIDKVHASGKKAYVLDIGTGTGILSMMAARCGADAVFACEFFKPMSACAEKIIALNGFKDKIKVIHKGSTQLTVGENGDLPHRANILVTEVFDTELIGEGAVKTFTHAQQELLEDNPIVIPSVGRVYAAVFESDLVNRFNKLHDLYVDDKAESHLRIPELIKNCMGSPAVHDIQLSLLPTSSFRLISQPVMVLNFDWTGGIPILKNETKFHKLVAEHDGTAHGVFMWWDLIMDPDGKITLTCAPSWACSNQEDYAWRDHWMQAVYYLPRNVHLKTNQEYTLVTNHDEFSLWFDLHCDKVNNVKYEMPGCDCGLHLTSRMRVGMINDVDRHRKFSKVLSELVSNDSVVLNLSECSFLGHYIALLGAKKVYCLESNHLFQNVLENVAKYNNIYDKVKWISSAEDIEKEINQACDKVSLIVAEPYFSSAVLPWHNLQFWYTKQSISNILSSNAKIIPSVVEFYLMPVQFEHLWKIRAPIRSVEGFSLEPFDEIIQEAITISDDVIDSQPLWEYTTVALAKPRKFLTLNLNDEVKPTSITVDEKIQFETDATCNGVVLWVKWILSDDVSISTGPVQDVTVGEKVVWDMYSKQGIYFFKHIENISSRNQLLCNIKFHIEHAMFEYNFKIM